MSQKPITTALMRIKLSVARGRLPSSGVSLDNSCLHWCKQLTAFTLSISYMYYVLVPRSIERRNQLLADISVTLKSSRSLVCHLRRFTESILNVGHGGTGGTVTSRMKYTILYTGHDVRNMRHRAPAVRLVELAPARSTTNHTPHNCTNTTFQVKSPQVGKFFGGGFCSDGNSLMTRAIPSNWCDLMWQWRNQ